MKTSQFVRLLSLVLCTCMVLGMFPVSAFATEGETVTTPETEHVHAGGVATCKELAVCECGESYGELTDHIPSEDGTVCTVCGATLVEETPTEPAPTETEPAPTETEPAPTETEPAPTETEPAPTETEPAPTETEPAPTETEPAPTETEPVPTETEPVSTGVITAWSWIDEYEVIDPETNIFTVISANEENPIAFDTVVEVLPAAITAAVDGTDTTVTLGGWTCEDYPEDGVYYGYWTFKAELPEGFTLAEGCAALEVQVYFDEAAGTYASGSAGGIEYKINSSASTDDYYNLISKKDWEIAPGINESQIVLNNDDGSYRQVLFVMEADLSNEYVEVINSYTGMVPEYGNYQVSGMTNQAAIAEKMGYGNVVGAMNTTLSWYTGYAADRVNEPLGFIMLDAEVLFDPANCGYEYGKVGFPSVLVINKDFDENGNPRPADIPKVEMPQITSAADLDGWEDQVIPCSSGYILKDGVNQSSPSHTGGAPRSVVGIKPDGTVVIMVNDGRQSPYSAGMSMYELAEVMLDLGCTYAVNCDGGGSTTWVSQRPGEEQKINNSPSDGAERSTTTGILFVSTAPSTGEFVRANITTDSEYYVPGSTVEFNALGTDLVGTAADIPEDVSWQIAEEGMGTIENGVFVSNGTVGTATAQMVYNEKVVGEKSVEIVMPQAFSFTSAAITVPYDKTVTIGLTATINDGRNEVTFTEKDVEISTTNAALGTFDGFSFTSVAEADAPEDITSVVTAKLKGTELTATVPLSLGKGTEVIEDFEDGVDTWNVGCVNNGGTNFYIDSADNEVHDGEKSLKLNINGLNFDNSAGSYKQIAIYPEEDIIIENAKSIGAWIYVPDEFYNLWIRFHYYYEGADGNYTNKNTVPVFNQPGVYNQVNESGWYYFSVDVSAYDSIMIKGGDTLGANEAKNCRFIEFNACHMATNDIWTTINGTLNGNYNIYVDSICADFSEAVDDREAPIFDSISLIGNEAETAMENHAVVSTTSNVLNVAAKVSENETKTNATGLDANSAKAYVDGISVDCTYSNGRISIANIAVADGVHRVKFEICDNAGNKSAVVRLVEVKSGVDASTIKVEPKDASLDRLYGGSVYWMNLTATDIETVQSVQTVIDLNSSNHWELDHMELAEGFTASYSVNTETNTATITITRTGSNTQTGEAVLASLPIRVIYYDTDINLEGYTAETYWTDYNFWSHDVKVDVDMGRITYVTGYAGNVLNTFSNEEFSVDTEWYTSGIKTDATYRAEHATSHVHTETALDDKDATCTEDGYTGRTYCEVCESVVSWGTKIKANGHNWQFNEENKLACVNNTEELFTGTYEGKEYVDGVLIADGWFEVGGVKTAYYKDGVKLTGSHVLDGEMYTFDENGVYLPDYQYEGFYEVDNTVMYFLVNKKATGYNRINSTPYFFDEQGLGYDGEYTINGETCTFDNGVFVSAENDNVLEAGWTGDAVEYVVYSDGRLVVTGEGNMWNYSTSSVVAPWSSYSQKHVKSISIGSGITHVGANSFRNCFVATSLTFAENSQLKRISNQAFQNLRSLKSVVLPESLLYLNPYAFGHCYALASVYVPANTTTINENAFGNVGEQLVLNVEEGTYAETFAKDNGISYTTRVHVVKNGVYNENGTLYYYENDVRTAAGLIKLDGYYYYASTGGVCKTGKYWVSRTNDLLPEGFYFFDETTSKMNIKNGVYSEDGGLYYYVDGVRTTAGLVKIGDDYYYVSTGGVCKTGKYWVTKNNGLLPSGFYFFDEETGKMVIKNGVYSEDGGLYYYEDGMRTAGGLVKVDGYYYYASTGGVCKTGKYWVTKNNGLLPSGFYFFDETTGRMDIKNGIYSEDGGLYYYVDGARTTAGLIQIDGDYYYASTDGVIRTGKYWVTKNNGLLPSGFYVFDETTGKMIL